MPRTLLLWIPACAHMALIFAASAVPGQQLPGRFWDKLVHFAVYALLGVLFLLPLARGRLSGVTARTAIAAVALAFVYGITDELHQGVVPHRTPDAMDVVADTIGAAAGVLTVLVVRLAIARPRSGAA
jgi:VanZ family protein